MVRFCVYYLWEGVGRELLPLYCSMVYLALELKYFEVFVLHIVTFI